MTNGVTNCFPAEFILYGGTGQAKVIKPIIEHYGSRVIAVFDDTPNLPSPFNDVPIYQGWELLAWRKEHRSQSIGFCVTIGNPHGRARLRIHDLLESMGLVPITLIHPTAWIAKNAEIGIGCQILAGAIVGNEAKLGKSCIINTKASVDHEDILEDGAEVAPGATLCGSVHMGIASWICAGATVLPRITIGADAVVGAGAVVTKDIPPGVTVMGVPAKSGSV